MDQTQTGPERHVEHSNTGIPHWARPWIKRLAFTLGGLVVLYFVVVFTLSRFLDPVRMANWLEPGVEAALNRDVEIDAVGVKIIPFGVRLENIAVADPTGLAPELARIELVDLKVALLPLIRRQIRVDRVSITGVTATMRENADGVSNFGDLATSDSAVGAGSTDAQTETPMNLEVRRISLENVSIEYSSVPDSTFMRVIDMNAEADIDRGELGRRAVGRVEGGLLYSADASSAGEPIALALDFDVEPDDAGENLVIHDAEILLGEVGVHVEGSVAGLQDSVRSLALAARADGLSVAQLVEALPDSMRSGIGSAEGTIDLDLRIDGPLGPERTPEVVGAAQLTGVGVESPTGATLVEGVAGAVQVEGAGVVRPRLSGRVLGGELEVGGVVLLGDSGSYELDLVGNMDLSRIAEAGLQTPLSVAGRARLDATARGPLNDPQGMSLVGALDVENLLMDHPALAPSIGVRQGSVVFHGDSASVSNLRVDLGQDGLTVSAGMRDLWRLMEAGTVPDMRATVAGSRLDLVRLSAEPPPDTALTYGRLAFARLGNRPLRGRSVEEIAEEMGLVRPESLPVAGQLRFRFDTLIDRRGRSESVHGVMDFGPGFIRVPSAELRRYGGTLTTRGDLALGSDATQPFSFYLDAKDVDAAQFFGATTPLGHIIRGTVTVNIDVAGSLDALLLPGQRSLVGTGSLHLRNGGLASNPVTERVTDFLGWEALRQPAIEDWRARFIVEDGTFLFEEGTLTGAPGQPRVSGRLGPDGLVDLLAAFALPTERLGAAALRRIGVPEAMTAELMAREGLVQALLKISGNLRNPVIAADPDASPAAALAEAAREAAREKVREEVEERRSDLEDRASGLLRGFLRNADPRRRADTARADSVRPAAGVPDSLPADTVAPADTITPADTVAPTDTVAPADTITPADTTVPHASSGATRPPAGDAAIASRTPNANR